tara:strand:+ start:8999 stop:10723 length:1725 start_codon:yes stop_codon:yes gene_type:complete
MKIIDKLNSINKEDIYYSFEYFPAKTEKGMYNLYQKIKRMTFLEPLFIDITWGAGGSTSKRTYNITQQCYRQLCIETQMHLTCTNISNNDIDTVLDNLAKDGIENILALRGDIPDNNNDLVKNSMTYASDLVEYIRKKYKNRFCISVAGYPDCHPESKSIEQDILNLKKKIDTGADYIITQFFFDVDNFFNYVNKCREIGIKCKIIPGILTISSYQGFIRMVDFCKCSVPSNILDDLKKIKDNDIDVIEYGINITVNLCKKLIENGFNVLHFYTLNREDITIKILDKLNLISKKQNKKELPWKARIDSSEGTRPIFWANNSEYYMERTKEWEHFPNGRWGNPDMDSFGDIDDYHLFSINLGSNEVKKKMWGKEITSINDIGERVIDFINEKIKYLPWCDNLSEETEIIKDKLEKINRSGYITTNSQPSLNAIDSDSKYGWGGKNGYIYQRAYIEFLSSPEKLNILLEKIKDKNYSYCSINYNGNIITNCEKSTNVITWGIFPNKEIIQPTIVDQRLFILWKDDIFNIIKNKWQNIYDKDSISYNVFENIKNNYYLTFIVDNNFINSDIYDVLCN